MTPAEIRMLAEGIFVLGPLWRRRSACFLRTEMIWAPNLAFLEICVGQRATTKAIQRWFLVEELVSGVQSRLEARVHRHNKALYLFSCWGWKIVYPAQNMTMRGLSDLRWPTSSHFEIKWQRPTIMYLDEVYYVNKILFLFFLLKNNQQLIFLGRT